MRSSTPSLTLFKSSVAGGVLVACASLAVLLSFPMEWRGAAFAQETSPTELCNGKDDNGNGVIDEGINCDHYLSYLVDKSINPISVVVRDQFIAATDFTLVLIERLFNPVKKTHAGIPFTPRRPDLHYLAYRLQDPASVAPHSVVIENQFEKRTIVATTPRYLLVPTGKRKTGITDALLSTVSPAALAKLVPTLPQNANHYLCYDVEPYDIVIKGVSLRDQFQNRKFDVIRARTLCNPAEKTHNGKVYAIVDEQNHLMCYEIIPHNAVNRPVLTRDQFGIRSLKPVRTEEVCVPTVKTPLTTACTRPDTRGTAVVFDAETSYHNTGGQLTIVEPTPAGEGLTADALLQSGADTAISRGGSPESGETYTFTTELLRLTLSSGRVLHVPVNGEIMTQPRMPGDPVQSFATDMIRLQGQLPAGDPDFDLLRITAGAGFGLPSPGHTTLTQLPAGNWNVDSFFDITYRIDFVGAPGGPLAGQSGSAVGTLQFEDACPSSGDTLK